MKILLINPQSYYSTWKNDFFPGGYLPPLNILYLARILEIEGHTVNVIDYMAEKFDIENLKKILSLYEVVGITIYSSENELDFSIRLSNFIKDTYPELTILIGGLYCSIFPKIALKEHKADICIIGDAFNLILPVIESLEGKKKISTIPGLYYRDGKKIKKTTKNNISNDFNDLPNPSRSLVDKYDYGYLRGIKISKGKTTSILTSTGCPFNCKFCNLNVFIPKYTSRSTNHIISELDEIIDQGYKTIAFVSDNFLFEEKKVEKIMDFLIQKNSDLKLWIGGARADNSNKILFQKMRDAGVEQISYGIESGNQEVLDYYNKNLTLPQIRKTIELSNKMGFYVAGSFILGSPIENEEHIKKTIRFAKSLPLDSVFFYPFIYSYKSDIWEKEVKEGNISPEEAGVLVNSNRGLGNFTPEKINIYINKANRSFYMNPSIWIRELRRIINKKEFYLIKLGLRLFVNKEYYNE